MFTLVFELIRKIDDTVKRCEQFVRQSVCKLSLEARPRLQHLLLNDVVDVTNQNKSWRHSNVVELFHLNLNCDFLSLVGWNLFGRAKSLINYRRVFLITLLRLLVKCKLVDATSCPALHDDVLQTYCLCGRWRSILFIPITRLFGGPLAEKEPLEDFALEVLDELRPHWAGFSN